MIWVSSKWELDIRISAQLVYLAGDHRNHSEEAEYSEKGRNQIEAPQGGSCQCYALGVALRPLEELMKNNIELPRLLCV